MALLRVQQLLRAIKERRTSQAPLLLLLFGQLGISDADLAGAFSISSAAVSQWRHGTEPIPRQRRVEMLAFLTCLREAFVRDVEENSQRLGPTDLNRSPSLLDVIVKHVWWQRLIGDVLEGEIDEEMRVDVEKEARRMRADVLAMRLRRAPHAGEEPAARETRAGRRRKGAPRGKRKS